jgi:hypothetical protein
MRKPNPFSSFSSVRKIFSDNFARPNTSNELGINDRGGRWDLILGAFRILSEKAVPVNNNEISIATINFPTTDVNISLEDIGNGSGAALWVSEAGDWWATVVDQTEEDCNCSTDISCVRYNSSNVSGYNTFESGGRNAFTYQTGTFCSGGNVAQQGFYFDYVDGGYCRRYVYIGGAQGVRCAEWNAFVFVTGYNATNYNTRVCNANFATGYNAPNFSNAIAGYNAKTCAQYVEFTFDCQTCYPQWIRFVQSVANTVSTVASFVVTRTFRTVTSSYGNLQLYVQDEFGQADIASMNVNINDKTISVDLYDNPDLTSKIEVDEEIVYTPTSAQVDDSYGIIVRPSSYNPNQGFGGINITRD